MKNMVPLYIPGKIPVLGMRSSISTQANDSAHWIDLINMNGSRFNLQARFGAALIGANVPAANAKLRGLWCDYLGGALTCIVAFEISSKVQLWVLNLSTYAWTGEITNSSTRFPTVADVTFAVAHEPGILTAAAVELDVLIASNGADTPRTIRRASDSSISTSTVAVASAVTFPASFEPTTQHYPECWFNLMDSTKVTYPTHTGAFNTIAPANTTAGSDDNECQIDFDGTATGTLEIQITSTSILSTADYTLTTGTSSFTFGSNCRYVAFLVEDNIADPAFNYFDVYLRNLSNTTYYPAWKAGDRGKVQPLYLPAATGVYLAVFDMSLYRADLATMGSMDRIKWVMDHAMPAARTVKIIGVYGLGIVPAGAQHAMSYIDTLSYVETGARVCKKIAGPLPRDVGGNKNRNFTPPEGVLGQNLCWTYIARVVKPPFSPVFQRVYLYRQDKNDDGYFLVGGYITVGGTTGFGAIHDRLEPPFKTFSRIAPSAFNVGPPIGLASESAAGRVYIGGILNNLTQVWISDAGHGMRFVEVAHDNDLNGVVDDDSGTIAKFEGEKVVRIKAMPGNVSGIAPVLVFTNKSMWRIEASTSLSLARPSRLNPHGTIYPATVAVHKSDVRYVDAEKKPRLYRLGSESVPLGIWKVEDKFEDCDIWRSHAAVFNERYYVWMRDVNETLQRKAMIYEDQVGEWWSHKYTTPDFAATFVQQVSGTDNGSFSTAHGSKYIGITTAGLVYQIEKPSKLVDDIDVSTTEAITITMKKFIPGNGMNLFEFGSPAIIWEKSVGGTLTIALSGPDDSTPPGVVSGTVVLDATNVADEAWKYALSSKKANPTIQSYGCTVLITGNPTPGKKCHGIALMNVKNLRPNDGGVSA